MMANDFLNQIRLLNYKIDEMEERLLRVRQSLLYKESSYETIGGGGGGGDNTERTPKLLAIEEQIMNEFQGLLKQKEYATVEVLSVIDRVECIDQSEVLYWLYVQDKTVAETSDLMLKNDKWVYRKRNAGIERVQDILDHSNNIKPKSIILFDTLQGKVVGKGNNKEIADILNISPQIVTAHVVQELPYLHFIMKYEEEKIR